jgi:hypothetical protein
MSDSEESEFVGDSSGDESAPGERRLTRRSAANGNYILTLTVKPFIFAALEVREFATSNICDH